MEFFKFLEKHKDPGVDEDLLKEAQRLALEKFRRAKAIVATYSQNCAVTCDFGGVVDLQGSISDKEKALLREQILKLSPWKKGPFKLFGIEIDSEWRSDLKFDRYKDVLPESLEGKKLLDIGANNGHYLFRLLARSPELLLGIEPVARPYYQFQLIRGLLPPPMKRKIFCHPWGIGEVSAFHSYFDIIFSMGILYHHPNPLQQLRDIRRALRPGGMAIIETLAVQIPNSQGLSLCLFPEERYLRMKNVFFIPNREAILTWLKRTKFQAIDIISDIPLDSKEQRVSKDGPSVSLENFMKGELSEEGLPPPRRIIALVRK